MSNNRDLALLPEYIQGKCKVDMFTHLKIPTVCRFFNEKLVKYLEKGNFRPLLQTMEQRKKMLNFMKLSVD